MCSNHVLRVYCLIKLRSSARSTGKLIEEAMSARHAEAESDLSKKNKHEMQAFRSQKEAADAATKARAESSAAIVVRNALTEASKSAAKAL